MAFFEQMAARASLRGHKAAHFAAAAQRHANAFWFLLVAAALTWWLAGWKWALIPAAAAAWTAFQSCSATVIQRHLERLEG